MPTSKPIKPIASGYFAVCGDTPTHTFKCLDNCLNWLDANCSENAAPIMEILQYPNQLPTALKIANWYHPTGYERF